MTNRRSFLGTLIGAAVALAVMPFRVWAARPDKAFEMDSVSEALKSQFGSDSLQPGDIKIKAPDIAENGAVVPVTVSSGMADVESIAILADSNNTPMVASFNLNGSEAYVSTRIKMGKTGNVVAVVKSGGKLYASKKEVKVTIGGCGG